MTTILRKWGKLMKTQIKKIGLNAVVSTARMEASKIAINILKSGGNAVDAAVAAGFALGVCEPSTSGLGGGGFMLIKTKDNENPVVIDFRESAPINSNEDIWNYDENGKVVNKENQIGGKSVATPGEVAGLLYALENYGTMSRQDVISPAIDLSESGFVVTKMMEKHFADYKKYMDDDKESLKVYFKDNCIEEGKVCRNKDLATTLKKIAQEGREAFYSGEIAQKIVQCVEKDGGSLTLEDLSEYEIKLRQGVRGSYRGYDIYTMGLPSSGGVHIVQMLNILENFDMSSLEINSPEYLHIFSEAFKKVYTDRAKFMADGDFYKVPLAGLTNKDYAKETAQSISMEKSQQVKLVDPWDYEHADTTHYSIGDSEGNMVSVTKTINHFCGACRIPKETGFLLNDTMADFSVVKGNINAVESGKKPLSTMAPTIICKDGKPFAILGSPGGERIICNVVQVISKLIDHQLTMDEAISSPRITENVKDKIIYEGLISEKTAEKLREMGHETEKVLDLDVKMGGVQGVLYTEEGIEGAADPRRDGVAIAY